MLLLLGGPGVVVLRSGGWLGYLVYAVYIVAVLALFDRSRDYWVRRGRAEIWFDLSVAAAGLLFGLIFPL